jgi:F-type H+-transporting ATPase subunit alpha
MQVIEQVVVIYAGTRGYLDKVKKELVVTWEQKFLEYMAVNGKEIMSSIQKEAKIVEDTEKSLKQMITNFNEIHSEWMLQEEG